jgi:anti-sigma B factor antagonist
MARYPIIRETTTALIVTVTEDLDVYHSPVLREAIAMTQTHDRAGRQGRIIIDLRATPYIDSTGLGVILGAQSRLAKTGAMLAVIVPRGSQVRMRFAITQLDKIVHCVEDVAEAELYFDQRVEAFLAEMETLTSA